MKEVLKKRLTWVIAAVILIVAALIFIRPQTPFGGRDTGTALSIEKVEVFGQDVTGEMADQLYEMLWGLRASHMMDEAQGWNAETCAVITGAYDAEEFTLVLGDYSVLNLGEASYRVHNGSDLLVQIVELLP